MKRWHGTLCYVVMLLWPSENANPGNMLLPGKNILNIIPEFLGQSVTEPVTTTALTTAQESTEHALLEDTSKTTSVEVLETKQVHYDKSPEPPELLHPVQYAGRARELQVYPLPLEESDHELKLNVTWLPSLGPPARDFSLEVRSVTNTADCKSPMCYEYNIPGNATWWLVPAFTNHVAETCAVRPGCAYKVVVTAHPWDGRTVADKLIELDECEAGVCSCAYSPRLPAPIVTAQTITQDGELVANISWTLPEPSFPQRLPRGLQKKNYFVSIGKQMVTDAHPSPWFANTITQRVDTSGPVATGESSRWLLLHIVERSGERQDQTKMLDVKLLARVNLIDERGCIGPAGNATAYDPDEMNKIPYENYIIWALLGGLCVLAMVAILAVSARAVKRILSALRPPPASAPLEPLRRRPAWLPLRLRT